jgi:hypothetical protein
MMGGDSFGGFGGFGGQGGSGPPGGGSCSQKTYIVNGQEVGEDEYNQMIGGMGGGGGGGGCPGGGSRTVWVNGVEVPAD